MARALRLLRAGAQHASPDRCSRCNTRVAFARQHRDNITHRQRVTCNTSMHAAIACDARVATNNRMYRATIFVH